jgi:hypothetical protein
MRRTLVLLILSAIPALFAGCGFNSSDRIVEETFEQTYQVDPGATVSLSNQDGSIRIYGADIKEIRLEATKKAYSIERLGKISVNVAATPDSVSITTSYPPRKRWGLADRSGTVDYILVVPQTCKISNASLANGEMLIDGMRGEFVNAHLKNGRLFGRNCFGNIRLSVAMGGLDIDYDWWEDRKFSINVEVENGGIHAFIPADASFHLMADAESGRISNDFAEQQQRHADDRKIDMLIGPAPKSEVILRARDGNIDLGATSP